MKNKLYSALIGSVLCCASANAYDYSSYSSSFSNDDYRTALNMGLKFFGGQRCGDTHNWMLNDNPNVSKKYCHTKDGQGSVYCKINEKGQPESCGNGNYDLTGGWHDCGDHIKVGTTMGYAATSLLVAYDLWPEAFQDNYDGEYGASNGIADVLDEAKIATDYFIKSFIDDNTFVYYVGDASDHREWRTSSAQSDRGTANGGDPRPVWTATDKGGPQAAAYSAALSLMARLYPDNDYKELCKTYAVKAYNFAVKNKSVHAPIPEFYGSPNTEWTDELSLAAILLYELTGEDKYLSDATGYLQNKWESNSPLAWDTMADYAYYYIAKNSPSANNGAGGTFASFLQKNVFDLHIRHTKHGEITSNGFPYYQSRWGTNKLALGGAAAAALYVKLVEDGVITSSENIEDAKKFNLRIVDYVLGNNEFNHTFLHGFKGDMHFRIHHRNAMGRDDNPPSNVKNSCDFMFASGGVIGGPSKFGTFENVIEGGASYTETEGGCDYNAPFIAAIASIVAEKDPVPSTSNALVQNDLNYNVYPTLFENYIVADPVENNCDGEITVQLFAANGTVVKVEKMNGFFPVIIKTDDLSKGEYFVVISTNCGTKASYKVIK